jgi:formate dehydrogenase iron-sulfur subunit
MNVCPVGAIVRTDQGNVVIRQDKCVGTKACNAACPYGVARYNETVRRSQKCTLCNDRIHNGLGTACAKACPTGSIRFGEVSELKAGADARLARLKSLGESRANIYGYTEAGGLNVFYLLMDKPTVYGLPEHPVIPQRPKNLPPLSSSSVLDVLTIGMAALVSFRERGARKDAEEKG